MIKNGKPYTNENGWEDSRLITDALPERQEQVAEWIDEYISPAKKKNPNHTSYTLKHRFARWLRENEKMSNNQFKDAMMTKGYMPVDPDELNWFYKIRVAEDSDDINKLQRKLLPDQNEVLKNFILRNFPKVEVEHKSKTTNSYRYFWVDVKWHLSRTLKHYTIDLWEDKYPTRGYWPEDMTGCAEHKTLILPYIDIKEGGDKE